MVVAASALAITRSDRCRVHRLMLHRATSGPAVTIQETLFPRLPFGGGSLSRPAARSFACAIHFSRSIRPERPDGYRPTPHSPRSTPRSERNARYRAHAGASRFAGLCHGCAAAYRQRRDAAITNHTVGVHDGPIHLRRLGLTRAAWRSTRRPAHRRSWKIAGVATAATIGSIIRGRFLSTIRLPGLSCPIQQLR